MALANRLAGVEIFVRTVAAGSFTAAASELGITKSAVAKSVSQLETRLGVRLLHRTTRRLSLTPEGSSYFEQARAAVEQLHQAELATMTRATTLQGVLRVDMPAAFGRRVALPVLLAILKAHPGLRLDASFSDRVIDPVEEGVDLCIRFGGLPDRTDIAARKLGEQRLVICASPDYLSGAGKPRSVEDLSAHSSIAVNRAGRAGPWRLSAAGSKVLNQDFVATHLCNDGEAVIAMALAGFGVCQMPESLVSGFIEQGRLVRVMDEATQVYWPLYAVWPMVRQMLPRVRVVVDELVRRAELQEL